MAYITNCIHLGPQSNTFWDCMRCCFRISLKRDILGSRIIVCKKNIWKQELFCSFVTSTCFIKQNVPTMFYFVPAWQLILQLITPPQKWLPQQSFSFLSNNLSLFYELTFTEQGHRSLLPMREREIAGVW